MSIQKNMKKTVSVQISAEVKDAAEVRADNEGLSMTSLVQFLLSAYGKNRVSIDVVPGEDLNNIETPIPIRL